MKVCKHGRMMECPICYAEKINLPSESNGLYVLVLLLIVLLIIAICSINANALLSPSNGGLAHSNGLLLSAPALVGSGAQSVVATNSSNMNVTVCTAPNAFRFDPKGTALNVTTGKLTQYGIIAMNQSACTCSYFLNNSANVTVGVTFNWNVTNSSYAARLNNATIPQSYNISVNATGCWNLTLDYINATRRLGNFTVNWSVT